MRGWQAIILAVAAGFFGLVTGNRFVEIASIALVTIVIIGVVYRVLSTGDVRGERVVGDSIIAWGDTFVQQITLSNHSRLGIPAIRVTDYSTLPDHPGGYVTSLQANRSITWDVSVPCLHRGRFRLGPVAAQMSDPIGMFPVEREIGTTSSVLVLPRWVPLTHSVFKLDGLLAGEARGQRRGETPPTVTSVREYVNGDSISAIHWQASARANQLMTKLFAPEVQTTLWLALDLDGELSAQVEEMLVTTTASIGMYALQRANLRVGLVGSGALPLMLLAERGKPHQYRMQELLAEAHFGTEYALAQQLSRIDQRLGPGQVVTLITSREPEVWTAWLARLKRRGVAARIIHVYDEKIPTPTSGWPVYNIKVSSSLTDLTRENELIALLEGRGSNL